jgi:hypothetical protein
MMGAKRTIYIVAIAITIPAIVVVVVCDGELCDAGFAGGD